MEQDNEIYDSLPSHIKNKIDKAFYSTVGYSDTKRKRANRPKQATKRKVDSGGGFFAEMDEEAPVSGGGFIPEAGGGGFIVDDDTQEHNDEQHPNHDDQAPEYIPLSHIPDALEILKLSSDDAQVMSVFRRAAADWGDIEHSNGPNDENEGEGVVSFNDWRAVCAVLLEDRSAEESNDSDAGNASDDYGEPSENDESDSDEYVETEEASRRRLRRTPAAKTTRRMRDSDYDSDDDPPSERPLSLRQRETCLQTFALFFPAEVTINLEELPKQRLRISDLQRVAGLLKEKLKADEIVEMLETFSTSKDKTMSLEDFERMMVKAKLV